jgi:hypothetical protein
LFLLLLSNSFHRSTCPSLPDESRIVRVQISPERDSKYLSFLLAAMPTISTNNGTSLVSIMAPSPSPAVEDGRTSRAPGTKTPRKVQWVDDRDPPDEMSDSTHALDEHGLDVSFSFFPLALSQMHGEAKNPGCIIFGLDDERVPIRSTP